MSDGPGDMARLDREAAAINVPKLPHIERVRLAISLIAMNWRQWNAAYNATAVWDLLEAIEAEGARRLQGDKR